MRKALFAMATFGLLTGAGLLQAQKPRVSPHETVTATLGGKKVTIEYGRPSMKGREIFGKLVPYGEVWRTGADEATILTTEGDLMLGSLHVPAGSYSLFTIPAADGWTIIVNNTAKQMGAFKYDEKTDLGRAKMKTEKAPATQQFTIALEPKGANAGTLRMTWDTVSATIPVMMH